MAEPTRNLEQDTQISNIWNLGPSVTLFILTTHPQLHQLSTFLNLCVF